MTSLDERIEKEVAALGDLSREELAARWVKIYGCPPPKGVKRGLLERAAAWHLQARYLGGFSPRARKAFRDADRIDGGASLSSARRTAADTANVASTEIAPQSSRSARCGDIPVAQMPALLPGTRLVREWNGRTHIVDIGENGFVFDGKTYRSLSAIAKRITGAHWSGPRFFGL
ncbi:DUF2924 domain-containing protein [Mesorhizobium sp. GR13]|uniref:DUF2924 domain-containing protein n=1 Tax=Mesorhizobium sp. GR13 TaxID=2562308 RepID=UPI0010BFD07A|nr:DUF2924 domain-containing protein [Mesorhizobium sp. GR13]